MSKVKVHAPFVEFSGKLGKIVYRQSRGKMTASLKPERNGQHEPTQAQLDHKERFRQAKIYAKLALAKAESRAFYKAAAKAKGISPFALGVGDFFNPPSIEAVDVSAYNGHEGSPIIILTIDDVGVVNVQVSITDGNGTTYESGNAVEIQPGGGAWIYTTTALMSPGMPVQVNVVAKDRPGGKAEQNFPVTIS